MEPKKPSDAALKYLSTLNWSGNVRQLENLCHWLTVMAPGQNVDIGDLPPEVREEVAAVETDWLKALEGEADKALNRGDRDLMGYFVTEVEKALIKKALRHTGGRRIEAAQLLGLGRNTLTRKIQELGLDNGGDEGK